MSLSSSCTQTRAHSQPWSCEMYVWPRSHLIHCSFLKDFYFLTEEYVADLYEGQGCSFALMVST